MVLRPVARLEAEDGARVVEVPYRFVDREHGASKLSAAEIVDYVRLLLTLRLKGRTWNSAHS